MRPDDLAPGSNRKVWWLCPEAEDHEWEAIVANRTRGAGCPFCAGKRVSRTSSLAYLLLELAAQWHPTRNDDLRPQDVSPGSNKKVWWLCPAAPGHEWEAVVHSRAKANLGCPFCSGRMTAPGSSLAEEYPEIARQWDASRNGDLRPQHVRPGSSKKVWWRCTREPSHRWDAPVYARTAEVVDRATAACPFCAGTRLSVERSLAALNPKLAAEWHPTKNGSLTPDGVFPSSRQIVWWRCAAGPDHVWRAPLNARASADGSAKAGCIFCASKHVSVTNSLATRFPTIAGEWHPTKNGALTPEKVLAGSPRRAWWKCDQGADHVWQAAVVKRTNPSGKPAGCPFCANKRVSTTNALSSRAPKIARQWHPTRNGSLRPRDIVYGSDHKAWWRCVVGHEWRAKVTDRVKRGTGCPECLLRKREPATTRRRPRERVLLPKDLE